MARCRVDRSIERVVTDGFDFPLGVYPIEPLSPREGYTVAFEPADGGMDDAQAPSSGMNRYAEGGRMGGGGLGAAGGRDEADLDEDDEPADPGDDSAGWEEWPDRYVWDVVVKASRLEAFCRALFAMLPGRIYPILDVLGVDAYREVDPYIAYELVGQERFVEALRRFRGFFYEDGMIGFGAMSEEPFVYVFVDEHKIVTIRAETALKEKVEAIIAAFDLPEVDRLSGADATLHEHRSVIEAPDDRPDLLTHEEIIEDLLDEWGLLLNVPGEGNLDDQKRELGITPWRCIVRLLGPKAAIRYVEVYLTAESLNTAQELAAEQAEELLFRQGESDDDEDDPIDVDVIVSDRMKPDDFRKAAPDGKGAKADLTINAAVTARWVGE